MGYGNIGKSEAISHISATLGTTNGLLKTMPFKGNYI